MKILPTNNSVDIYQYPNSQLKYLAEKSAATLLKPFLYSNKSVYLDENVDRRDFDDNTPAKRSDPNLTYRLEQLSDYIFAKNEYRIPLGFLTDLGLRNFPVQTNTKITITLETDMSRLFESNKKVTALPTASPNAVIRFHDRRNVSYQELTLTAVYETYLKTILRSEAALRMGVLPAPFQQLFEINTGAQSHTVSFKGAERQFDWLELSLVYDKSYQHQTVYDSYDIELAAKLIQSIKFENTSKAYSLTGKLEHDFKNKDDENLLYKMFIAYNCNGWLHISYNNSI